jgi:hypothetical protein
MKSTASFKLSKQSKIYIANQLDSEKKNQLKKTLINGELYSQLRPAPAKKSNRSAGAPSDTQ